MPRPNDKERKNLISRINKQISHLTEQRTSVAEKKVGPADRAKLYSILITESDNFTRHLQPHLRSAFRPRSRLWGASSAANRRRLSLNVLSMWQAAVPASRQPRPGPQGLTRPSPTRASWPCPSGLWPCQPVGRTLAPEAGICGHRLRSCSTPPRRDGLNHEARTLARRDWPAGERGPPKENPRSWECPRGLAGVGPAHYAVRQGHSMAALRDVRPLRPDGTPQSGVAMSRRPPCSYRD
jgi:hypothetical protein